MPDNSRFYMISHHRTQRGFGTIAAIAALCALGVTFLLLFLLSDASRPGNNLTKNNQQNQQNQNQNQNQAEAEVAPSTEPAYIRIPENSEIYKNSTYNFMFAYPDSFGQLSQKTNETTPTIIYRAESAVAVRKPVGIGTAFLTGSLGVYIFKKDNFEVTISTTGTAVAPTKTGKDTTWKIVDKGANQEIFKIGDAYEVKSIKSQTGIPVFEFSVKTNSFSIFTRYVFELKDHYAVVALPNIIKSDNSAITDSDIAAYSIIGTNVAKTVRIPPAKDTSSQNNSTDGSDTSSDNNSSD